MLVWMIWIKKETYHWMGTHNPIESLEDYDEEEVDTQEEHIRKDLKPKMELDTNKKQQKNGSYDEEKMGVEEIIMADQ